MERRKKGDNGQWVTPGVFSGSFVVEEAVEKTNTVRQCEQPLPAVEEQQLQMKMEQLETQLTDLREALVSSEDRWKRMEADFKKEREYLYQVVLSLKKEWENERNEHRHH